MIITKDNGWGRIDNFEVVDKMPIGYEVWNIPALDGYEDYIPLCQLHDGTQNVKLDTLKAVKVGDRNASVLRKAANQGFTNIYRTKRYLNNSRNVHKRVLAEAAFEIFSQII